MRRPTISRKSAPALIGAALVAVSVIAGSLVAALSGSPDSAVRSRAGILASGSSPRRGAAAGASGDVRPASSGGNSAGATELRLPGPAPAVGQSDNSNTPAGGDGGTGSTGTGTGSTGTGTGTGSTGGGSSSGGSTAAAQPRLLVPDIIASVPGGVTAADLTRIRRIGQVRAVLPVAGARITVKGAAMTVLGASATSLRPWTPPETAGDTGVWATFGKGDLITTSAAARSAGLRDGAAYPVSAAVRTRLTFGGSALLSVTGVDSIVDETQARRLGLVSNVAVLINAPAANMTTLAGQVRQTLGTASQVIVLAPVTVSTKLPVDSQAPTGRPASYLSLYQESAAQYCPGLSWTVLAAIGQIESDDGANDGPSTAGALGPMQFMPSTWTIWGTTAFGETGAPNVMDPFDAVPSAARMLCADGAAGGGQSLRQAIFDYNHADWYVDEVLTLASEYATEFG